MPSKRRLTTGTTKASSSSKPRPSKRVKHGTQKDDGAHLACNHEILQKVPQLQMDPTIAIAASAKKSNEIEFCYNEWSWKLVQKIAILSKEGTNFFENEMELSSSANQAPRKLSHGQLYDNLSIHRRQSKFYTCRNKPMLSLANGTLYVSMNPMNGRRSLYAGCDIKKGTPITPYGGDFVERSVAQKWTDDEKRYCLLLKDLDFAYVTDGRTLASCFPHQGEIILPTLAKDEITYQKNNQWSNWIYGESQ